MNKKPIVKIKDYELTDTNGYWHLRGKVQDHPRFEKDELVTTSEIVRVETRNTIYELENE